MVGKLVARITVIGCYVVSACSPVDATSSTASLEEDGPAVDEPAASPEVLAALARHDSLLVRARERDAVVGDQIIREIALDDFD